MIRACSRSRLRNPGAGSGSTFNPLSLFTASEQGGWYDPSDMTTLFQDNLGAVPVTAAGQAVGMIKDKSGRGNDATQATEASKPILRNTGALWWLEFDGVDDFLTTASINFTATDKMSLWAGLTRGKDTSTGVVAELSSNSTNQSAFLFTAPEGITNDIALSNRAAGGLVSSAMYDDGATPQTSVVSGGIDRALATNEITYLRSNGTTPTLSRPANNDTGGNFGNFPLFIGRRGGLTLPFVGNLYGMIIRGALSDALTVSGAESYMASKTGILL